MTQTISPTAPVALDAYTLQDAAAVCGFIAEHLHLVPLLEEAPSHIKEFFPDAELVLQVVQDPEEDHRELMISIHTHLPVKQAYAQNKALDAAWWFPNSHQAACDLFIALECA